MTTLLRLVRGLLTGRRSAGAIEARPPAFEALEARQLLSATLLGAIGDQSFAGPLNQSLAAVSTIFDEPDIDGSVARFDSVLGTIHIELFDALTPATATNFRNYVEDGDYNDPVTGDNFIHRSVPGFVVQGGGFNWDGTQPVSVPTDPPVVNEFANLAKVAGAGAVLNVGDTTIQLPGGTDLSEVQAGDRIRVIGAAGGIGDLQDFFDITAVDDDNDTVVVPLDQAPALTAGGLSWHIAGDVNTRGTVAMAKLGGDPNSATSQWFFNLANNAANLDTQNGGFTTFARVLFDDMDVVDDIAALQIVNAGGAFSNLPVIDFPGGNVQTQNLVRFTDIAMVEELSFEIENDRPDLVTISIVNGQIQAVSDGDTAGTANIVITATDLQGNSVEDAFSVDIVVPQITVADVVVDENAGTATLTLDLSHASTDTISLDYATADGTAEAGTDYTADAGTVTFNPGQIQKQIDVALSNDGLIEFNETFTVDLTNLSGLATLPDPSATVTIDDDDSDQVDFGGKTSGVFTDDDGDEVKLTLRGEGTGAALLPVGGVGDPLRIRLDGTTTRSSFTASAKGGGGEINVTDIEVDGSLSALTGKAVNLLGDLSVTGWAKKIQLKNVLDDHNIVIGPPDTDKDTVSFTFGRVGDLVLDSQTPIKSLTAVEWKDLGGPDDSITAPWMGTLKVKGDKKLAIDGDFEADLALSGVGAPGQTLKSAKIAGDVRNADWSLTGDSGAIDIRGEVENFTLDVMSSVKSLKLGRVTSADVTVDGSAGSVSATEWLAGSLTADTLKSLQTKGDKKEFVAGDFNADVTLTGDPDAKQTLPRAKVAGGVTGSNWSITGDAGTIDIRGTTDGWTLNLFSSVKTIKLAMVNQADLTIGLPDGDGKRGDVGNLSAKQWEAGLIRAGSIKSLATKADSKLVGAEGDFKADVELTGSANEKITNALGKLAVAGRLQNSEIRAKDNVGTATVGAMHGSILFVGVLDAVTDLPDAPGDFESALLLKSLTIKGIKDEAEPSFSDSLVAASEIGKAVLRQVQTLNAASVFGLAAQTLGIYSRLDAMGTKVTADPPPTLDQEDDYIVRLV